MGLCPDVSDSAEAAKETVRLNGRTPFLEKVTDILRD
jgi:hypothetical protein